MNWIRHRRLGIYGLNERVVVNKKDKDKANPGSKSNKLYAVGIFLLGAIATALISYAVDLLPKPKNTPPVVGELKLTPAEGVIPFEVAASTQVADDDDTITYRWFLNDKLTSKSSSPVHLFMINKPGNHKIRAEVSDGRIGKPIQIHNFVSGKEKENVVPIIEELKLSKEVGFFPFTVTATARVTDKDDDALAYSWFLDEQLIAKSTSRIQDFTFDKPGHFEIRVEVSDGRVDMPVERRAGVTSKRERHSINERELAGDLTVNEPEKIIVLPEILYTNGYSINITAAELAGSRCLIKAFPESKEKAPNGSDGKSGSEGNAGQDGVGSHGQSGTAGKPGEAGAEGKASGDIRLNAKSIQVQLTIENNAQHGGNGGAGGEGGRGGKGGQGKPSVDSVAGFCKAGPGQGGDGGGGGKGGTAGDAGGGGDAGAVLVVTENLAKPLSINAAGGVAGKPGRIGEGGKLGNGGAEGRLTPNCDTANRVGTPGKPGANGDTGKNATTGNDGKIVVDIAGKKFTALKTFKK